MAHEQTPAPSLRDLLWAAPLIAAVLLPGIEWIVAERPMAARIRLAVVMTIIVVVVAAVVLTVVYIVSGRRLRWSLSVSAMVILALFQWWILNMGREILIEAAPIGLLADAFPVAVAGSLLWIAARIGDERGFAAVTAGGLWLIAIFLTFAAAPMVQNTDPIARPSQADPNAPDVLLVILDGYARSDILESRFGYDNSSFVAALEDMDFYVAEEARPNYSYTFASLTAMFEFDYTFDLGDISEADRVGMRSALSGDSLMTRSYQERGYDVAYLENAWAGSNCGPSVDVCVRDGIVERSLWNLSQMTILAPIYGNIRPHPFSSVSLEHLETLGPMVTKASGDTGPVLTIAHILLPHPPLLLDAECNVDRSPGRRGFTAATPAAVQPRRDFYIDQISCVNSLMISALETIIDTNPNTIVMITADHGPDSAATSEGLFDTTLAEAQVERMSVLSAYRVPGCDDLVYSSMTPVNGTRAITSCALGIDLERLPDRTMWVTGETGEVTSLDSLFPDQG